MLDTLVSSVENTFVQFSIRRLMYITFLLVVVLGGAYVFDRETGYSSQRRLDARLSALERLNTLESRGIRNSPTLAPLYAATIALIQDQPTSPFS